MRSSPTATLTTLCELDKDVLHAPSYGGEEDCKDTEKPETIDDEDQDASQDDEDFTSDGESPETEVQGHHTDDESHCFEVSEFEVVIRKEDEVKSCATKENEEGSETLLVCTISAGRVKKYDDH